MSYLINQINTPLLSRVCDLNMASDIMFSVNAQYCTSKLTILTGCLASTGDRIIRQSPTVLLPSASTLNVLVVGGLSMSVNLGNLMAGKPHFGVPHQQPELDALPK